MGNKKRIVIECSPGRILGEDGYPVFKDTIPSVFIMGIAEILGVKKESIEEDDGSWLWYIDDVPECEYKSKKLHLKQYLDESVKRDDICDYNLFYSDNDKCLEVAIGCNWGARREDPCEYISNVAAFFDVSKEDVPKVSSFFASEGTWYFSQTLISEENYKANKSKAVTYLRSLYDEEAISAYRLSFRIFKDRKG